MSVRRVETASPVYTMDDILQHTRPPLSGGGFRRVLGAVAGGATNIFAPGIGSIIGGLISGSGGLPTGGLLSESSQFLELQRRIQMESRAFETASAVLKSRHDAAMSAIRNIR